MAPKRTPWVSEVATRMEAAATSARDALDKSNVERLAAVPKGAPWRRPKNTLPAQDELTALRVGGTSALAFEPSRQQVIVEGRPVVVLSFPMHSYKGALLRIPFAYLLIIVLIVSKTYFDMV